jgi:hypothetical protein
MAQSAASKRYNLRVLWLGLAYAALLIGANLAFNRQLLGGPMMWLAAIAPALPIIGIFGAIGRYLVEEQDEYVRMLMVRQTLWASGFAISVATIWGFVESFGLAGHVDSYYIAVLWFGGLGLGACINRATLGAAAGC